MRQTWLVVALLPIIWSVCVGENDEWTKHHTNAEVKAIMDGVHGRCPDRTRVYKLDYEDYASGTKRDTTFRGEHLWVIEFSSKPGNHEPGKPDFKYIGNMHGNEVVGKEILLRLIDFLCGVIRNEVDVPGDSWTRDNILWLLDNTNIHILPSMNPDGWKVANAVEDKTNPNAWTIGRNNSHVDLNRNFPDLDQKYYLHENDYKPHNNHLERLKDELKEPNDYEAETKMLMTWIHSVPWVLSANMHGGDLVANYPFDEARPGKPRDAATTPDNALFKNLALSYSTAHKKMAEGIKSCDPNEGFSEGTTNGAKWYSVPRGMQDYNYLASNCFEITLELGCEKFPPGNQLPMYWGDNFNALINYMFQAHAGIRGNIAVPDGNENVPVVIKVYKLEGQETHYINHDILSTNYKDYFRLLNDGDYIINASYTFWNEEQGIDKEFVIKKCVSIKNSLGKKAQVLDFDFRKDDNADDGCNVVKQVGPIVDRMENDYMDELREEQLYKILRGMWKNRNIY